MSFQELPRVFVVGEAAGPWGCRFSGVPFTGEAQLFKGELPFAGQQSSKPNEATSRKPPYSSLSAKIFWDVMLPYHPDFLVWDCVPLHPHKVNEPLSVRNPTTSEIREHSGSLRLVLKLVEPEVIVAVGRKAEDALRHVSVKSKYVRHPSRGGKNEFICGMKRIFQDYGCT